ncbi:hypothetical protein HF086_001386 [Spodoptera exigua]|uniref:Major facilitator superfamily (MFS) profile domain-containing protein n=1 Tax=Spodoptera exigua TaxID=7107 RepID=A0A922MCL6_SPOEX|nr:hypothetical protein HF086_001386 [Spodoptera exigua]
MDRECDDADENIQLLSDVDHERTTSDSNLNSVMVHRTASQDTIVFNSKMMKTSTLTDDMGATWGGRRSLPDSGRLRRVHSWSGGPPDDISSEIIILRERLVRTQARLQPGAVRHLSSRQRLTLASLALVDFMSFCSMSVMAPFFPREAAAKGLSETMCGIVFSFYAVVMFLTSPLFGKFLPTVGAKFLFTGGMFVAGACNVLFGTLALIEDTQMFTILCFVVRGMEALGASAYSTASYVFVVNTFPDSIGSVLGILETFIGLGMSVGPAIGGLLYTIGGFGLPFYTLGVIMVLTVPINFFLLTDCEEYVSGSKTASIMALFKIPSIIITGLVIVIVSNTWAFLDPTLEPHLRQFGLSTEQIGLIFLLFSSLYGIFSPIWGWVADRDLWLDLVALSILGMSVALTLLPTFQGVLTSSIYEGGCPEALTTYSAVAGVWSCCYSLGEAVVTLTFFSLRESRKCTQSSGSACDSIPYTDTTWNSNNFCRTRSAPQSLAEHAPLITSCSCYNTHGFTYGTSPPKHFCLLHNKSNKSGYASIAEIAAYILKFQFVTSFYIKMRKSRRKALTPPPSKPVFDEQLYQNYLDKENDESCVKQRINSDGYINMTKKSDNYCSYLEDAIFGSPDIMNNVSADHLKVKKHNTGLVSTEKRCETEKRTTYEIIRHNLEKVQFYEQDECPAFEDIFDSCGCRDGVTYVRGTVTVSSTGACEV